MNGAFLYPLYRINKFGMSLGDKSIKIKLR